MKNINTIPTTQNLLNEICGCLKTDYDNLSDDELSFLLELINNWKDIHVEDTVKKLQNLKLQ